MCLVVLVRQSRQKLWVLGHFGGWDTLADSWCAVALSHFGRCLLANVNEFEVVQNTKVSTAKQAFFSLETDTDNVNGNDAGGFVV